MTRYNLASMPYAQAEVFCHKGNHTLVSYETAAASITKEGLLIVSCLCSQTTRRHVKAFLHDLTFDKVGYQTAKAIHKSHEALNLHTGEVVPIPKGFEY